MAYPNGKRPFEVPGSEWNLAVNGTTKPMTDVDNVSKRQKIWDGTVSWDEKGEAFFSMGEGTLRIPMAMHREHRKKLTTYLQANCKDLLNPIVVLEGGDETPNFDTDTSHDFRQESNFQYLFGVKEPGCRAALRVSDGHAVLFIQKHPKEFAAWMGPIRSKDWFRRAYGVDAVFYLDETYEALKDLGGPKCTLVWYHGTNRDSGASLPKPSFLNESVFHGTESFLVNDSVLFDALNELRLQKSPEELNVLQYTNDVSSLAHIEVMRTTKVNTREYLAEATFRYQAALRGCARMGYCCICPAGPRNSILHYGWAAEPNAERVLDGDMKLHDLGAEYHCYTADITCSFPASGRFTAAQRVVYEAVWATVLAVETTIRPGVSYKDMHRLAQRTLLEQMSNAGLFVGDVDEMMKVDLCGFFMPHGLGHNMGLDVHDVGGYPPGVTRKDDPTIKQNLRLGRELQENQVFTVEPGFYFADYLIEEVMADPAKACFINKARLAELRSVGGIRIEDNVAITSDGCRVLTNVPRTVEEVEAVMAGQAWVPGMYRKYVNNSVSKF